MEFQRDTFIKKIFDLAQKDSNIYFISADFGAPALDQFREKLPEQFIHAGISEQNMIDVAAGLSLAGNKVYVYAMAPFITLRCYEQLKCSLAMMDLPITVIAVGPGLGYADAGPTHYLTEDFACLRALVNCEVYSVSDSIMSKELAELTYQDPALRIIRLDRNSSPDIYSKYNLDLKRGFSELYSGDDTCIVSYGYTLQKILKDYDDIANGRKIGVIDFFKAKYVDLNECEKLFTKYKNIVTVEEQTLSGGLGSLVLEIISDLGMKNIVQRIGLEERYYFENGGRDFLLDQFGLSANRIKISLDNLEKLAN